MSSRTSARAGRVGLGRVGLGRVGLGRVGLAGAALAWLVALAACSGSADAVSGKGPDPSGSPTREAAALAGGACQLLDYDMVEAQIGARFAVAASATSGATFTCVLQPDGASEPDLELAVTATQADQSVFRSSVLPKGATVIPDLGKIGYQVAVRAATGTGPGLEVGWLSGNQRLMVLRYRSAEGTAAADVTALAPKLVELAKKIDMTTV